MKQEFIDKCTKDNEKCIDDILNIFKQIPSISVLSSKLKKSRDSFLLLKSRILQIKNQENCGLIEYKESSIIRNQIFQGTLNEIETIPQIFWDFETGVNEEHLFWLDCLKKNTIKNYNDYLEKFPQGRYILRATKKLNILIKEQEKNIPKLTKIIFNTPEEEELHNQKTLELYKAVNLNQKNTDKWVRDISNNWKDVIDISNNTTHNEIEVITSKQNLDLSNKQIKNLEPLVNFQNLTDLNITNTSVDDLSPIVNCENITNLNISKTQISDLLALYDKDKLQYLNSSYTFIQSILPLINSKNLKELDVSNTKLINLDGYNNLLPISKLNLNNTPIDNLNQLSNNQNIKHLDISNTNIRDLNVIKTFTNLEHFNASNLKISINFSFELNINLHFLNISNTLTDSLEFLKNNFKLKFLNIVNTAIKTLEPLYKIKSLLELHYSADKISNKEIEDYKIINPGCKLIPYGEIPLKKEEKKDDIKTDEPEKTSQKNKNIKKVAFFSILTILLGLIVFFGFKYFNNYKEKKFSNYLIEAEYNFKDVNWGYITDSDIKLQKCDLAAYNYLNAFFILNKAKNLKINEDKIDSISLLYVNNIDEIIFYSEKKIKEILSDKDEIDNLNLTLKELKIYK